MQLNENQLKEAALRAYTATQITAGNPVNEKVYNLEMDKWLAVAKAVCEDLEKDSDWPLNARVWTRTRNGTPSEKVLEIRLFGFKR